MNAGRPKKVAVRQVACPRCGAAAATPCINLWTRSNRGRHHIERVERYRDGMYGPMPPIDASNEEQN